ncbi:MAG: PAS domain S-box protein [Deltaproteobacteria bacterium]|nr:PAS domain S-box protein [Deltaproteobacteria bacterium]
MSSGSFWVLVQTPVKREAQENAFHFDKRDMALGLFGNGTFVDGDETFLSLLGKPSYPVKLEEVFNPEHTKMLLQVFSEPASPALYFEVERRSERYMVSTFRSTTDKDRYFWLVVDKTSHPTGKPIVGFEQRYRRLFENLKDAVFASTVEGRFIDINPAGVEMLGYSSKEEVLKLNILTDLYYYPEDRLKYQEIIARQGYVRDYEVVFKKKDKTPLFVSMSNIAVYDEERKVLGYEGIFRDLTRQKQIEEELKRKNAQLESYVYTVSHDLKSPVIAIQGFSRLLMRRYRDVLDKKGVELLERIMGISKRIEKMIMDLLAYSKAEKDAVGEFEFIDTYQVVQSIIEELKLKWEGHPVTFNVSEGLPEILFHPGSFRQIMSNLIDNAIKYSRQSPSSVVTIDCWIEDGSVVFSVKDNGIGIDPALQDKIFDVFERGEAPEEIEGTGIGLSIIKRIIETHHGKIWLDSEKGKGTTFYVRLPVRTLKRKETASHRDGALM